MHKDILYIGIDIGGAHLKVIGITKSGQVRFISYISCRIWENFENLRINFKKINKVFSNKSIKCAITISAELCDNFNNRNHGAKALKNECKYLKFENYFYIKSDKVFSKSPIHSDLISMNWHSIGRFLEGKIDNSILIDFGSTTTDFICIKNKKMVNIFFDDYARLNNFELLYTGFSRTPIFGIANKIKINNKTLNIIPELFSETSDVYRVLGQMNKKFDIDRTADGTNKNLHNSLKRISRSFGFDYVKGSKSKVQNICEELCRIQLSQIVLTISRLQDKFSLKKSTLVVSGIGQDILADFLKKKKMHVKYFEEFFIKSPLNKEASFHAPALSIASLLHKLK